MGSKKKEEKEKPLERLTAKDLREIAKEIPEVSGVYGMNKPELISAIKKARGIVEEAPKKGESSVRDIKKKIRSLRADQGAAQAADEKKKAKILRRKISRLKKQTRRAA